MPMPFSSGVRAQIFCPGRPGRLNRLTLGTKVAVVPVEQTSSCSEASFNDEDRRINEILWDVFRSDEEVTLEVTSSGDTPSLR